MGTRLIIFVLKRCHKLPQGTKEVLETREILCCPQTMPQITTGHPRIPLDSRNNLLSSNDATNYHKAPQRSLRLEKNFVALKRCHKLPPGTPEYLGTREMICCPK